MKKTKLCKNCNNELTGLQRKYCSKSCSSKGILKSVAKRGITAFCKICSKRFLKKSIHQIYCSNDCSKIFHKNAYLEKRTLNFSIFERDEFRCIYCGKSSIEDGVKLTVDHVKALIKGGNEDIINLITACLSCNAQKSEKELSDEVIERIKDVIRKRNLNLSEEQLNGVLKHAGMITR